MAAQSRHDLGMEASRWHSWLNRVLKDEQDLTKQRGEKGVQGGDHAQWRGAMEQDGAVPTQGTVGEPAGTVGMVGPVGCVCARAVWSSVWQWSAES